MNKNICTMPAHTPGNSDKCKRTTKYIILHEKVLCRIGVSDALYFMFLGYSEFRLSARASGYI